MMVDPTNWKHDSRARFSRAGIGSLVPDHKHRAGLTLIELLLVVAIVVIVAALSIPAVQRTIKTQGVRSAAYRVSTAMGQARVKSIRSGEVYAMFYGQNGSWFDVAPLSDYRDIVGRRAQREKALQNQPNRNLEYDLLPEGVQFIAGASADDSRSAASKEGVGSASGLEMVLFYPDGTSQDAQVQLQNQMGDVWRVELRGLTGAASAMRVDNLSGQR